MLTKPAFTRIVPNEPFSLDGEGIGAWELAVRMENLDLNDSAINGGEMDRYVLGMNWHPNSYLRFMANYTLIDTDENASIANDNTHTMGIRAQVDF